MEASPTVVIKVKYGDMLRRFSAQIVDEELDLSMDGLREKILSLFGFAPRTELMLSYMDEDGDEVTLVDPNDLRDVVKQGLDPLKINVKLISEKDATQFKYLSGSSTPLRSPPAQQVLQNLHTGVTEVLNTMPEPLFGTLLKLATDITSNSSFSAPGIIELVDNFSKMGFPDLGQPRESKTRVHPNRNSDIPGTKDLELSKGNAVDVKLPSNCREVQFQPETTTENNKVKPINVTEGSMETLSSRKFGLKATAGACGSKNINVGMNDKVKKISESYPNGKSESSYSPSLVNQNFSAEKKLGESSKSYEHSSGGNIFPSEKEFNEHTDFTVGQNTGNISSDSVKGGSLDSWMGCALPGVLGGFSGSISVSKLDSSVIRDLNVIDGTIMAPLTPFTKIWRMRNTGMVLWPQKTILRWIGGDRFTNHVFVAVDIPAAGFPVGDDLDVAADFIAPEHPGLYTSHWRMVSPSGEMFGQRVWVRIQVDASLKETPPERICGFDLNSPPLRVQITNPGIINVEAQPIAEDQPKLDNSKKTVDVVNPVVDLQPNNCQTLKFPIDNSLLVDVVAPNYVPSAIPSVPYPSRKNLCPPPPPPPQNLAIQQQNILLAQHQAALQRHNAALQRHNAALQLQNAAFQRFNAVSGGSTSTPSAVPYPSRQILCPPPPPPQNLALQQKNMLLAQQQAALQQQASLQLQNAAFQRFKAASHGSTSTPSAVSHPSFQSQYLANLQKSMLAFQQSSAAQSGVSVPSPIPSPQPQNIASLQKSTVDLQANASNGGSVSAPSAVGTVPYPSMQIPYPAPLPQDIASRQKSLVDLLAKANGGSASAPSAGVSVPYPIRQTPYPSPTPQNIATLQKYLVELQSKAINGGLTSASSAGVSVPNIIPSPAPQNIASLQNSTVNLQPTSNGGCGSTSAPPAGVSVPHPSMQIPYPSPPPQNTASSQKSKLDLNLLGNMDGSGGSTSAPSAGLSVSDPIIYIPHPSAPPAPNSNLRESAVQLSGNKEVEEVLLRKLEDMGFKKFELNKEALRINEYDLEQAVDDLCGVAEWYPILEELKKMGFHDAKLNKMLLEKNNGSIKDVVMELIGEDDLEW